MKRYLTFAAVIAGVCLATGECVGAVSAPRGYSASYTDLSIPTWFGGFDYLPDGRLIISDSTDVYILEEDGTKTVVAHFEQPGLFGSFVEVPQHFWGEVYVGESSVGTISSFPLEYGWVCSIGPGTLQVVAELPFNYDMDLDSLGRPFVSAAIPGSDPPANGLFWLYDFDDRTHLIAQLDGWSGPLAFDQKGNLFYCTATSYPPAPVERIVFFRREQVDAAFGGAVLTESDAQVLVTGIYGLSDMVFLDYGHLFGVTSSGQIVEIRVEGEKVATTTFSHVSPDALGATVVRYVTGKRPFEAYYQDGGTLTFLESDFGSLYRLVHVTPTVPFEFTALNPSEDGLNISFATEERRCYQVRWSEDAASSGWHNLGDAVVGEGVPISVVDRGDLIAGIPSPASPSVRQRFYKLEYSRCN